MRRRILLKRRFWLYLCLLTSLALSGGGLLALEFQQAFIGMFLLTVAGALLVVLVDGRLIKDRMYTLMDAFFALIAILGMFLPFLPIADYLLMSTPFAWVFLAGMVLLATLALLEAWRSYRQGEGESSHPGR